MKVFKIAAITIIIFMISGCIGNSQKPAVLEKTTDGLKVGNFLFKYSGLNLISEEDISPVKRIYDGGKRLIFDDGSVFIYYVFLREGNEKELEGFVNFFIEINENQTIGKNFNGITLTGLSRPEKDSYKGYPATFIIMNFTSEFGEVSPTKLYFLYCNNILVELKDVSGLFDSPSCIK